MKKLSLFILFAALLSAIPAYCRTVSNAQVDRITLISGHATPSLIGLAYIHVTGAWDALANPSCTPAVGATLASILANQMTYTFTIIDENSTLGKQQYSQALYAMMTKTPVTVVGTGDCRRNAGQEALQSLTLLPN